MSDEDFDGPAPSEPCAFGGCDGFAAPGCDGYCTEHDDAREWGVKW
jgi:hypothetical protein